MILYTTQCPKCKVLEKKLVQAGLNFDISEDIQKLISMGYQFAPVLETDEGNFLNFNEAVQYINNLK